MQLAAIELFSTAGNGIAYELTVLVDNHCRGERRQALNDFASLALGIKGDIAIRYALLRKDILGFLLGIVGIRCLGIYAQNVYALILVLIGKLLKHGHFLYAACATVEPERQDGNLVLLEGLVVVRCSGRNVGCLKCGERISAFQVHLRCCLRWNIGRAGLLLFRS